MPQLPSQSPSDGVPPQPVLDAPLRRDLTPPLAKASAATPSGSTRPTSGAEAGHVPGYGRWGRAAASGWPLDRGAQPRSRSRGRSSLVAVAAPAPSHLCRGGFASAQAGSVRPCGKPSAAAAGQSWRRRTDERTGGRQGLRRLLSSAAGPAPGGRVPLPPPSGPSSLPVCLGKTQNPVGASPAPGGWECNPDTPFQFRP